MKSLRNRRISKKNRKPLRKTKKNKKINRKTIKNQLGGSIENFIKKIQEVCKNIDIKIVKKNLKIIKKNHPQHYQLIKSSVVELKKYIDIGQILLATLSKKDINRLTKINNKQIYNLFSSYQLGGGLGDWMPMIIIIIGLVFLASKMGLLNMFSGTGMGMGMGMGMGKNTTEKKNSKGNNSKGNNTVDSSEEAGNEEGDGEEGNGEEGNGEEGNGEEGNGEEGNGEEGNGEEGEDKEDEEGEENSNKNNEDNSNEGNGNEGNKENNANSKEGGDFAKLLTNALTK